MLERIQTIRKFRQGRISFYRSLLKPMLSNKLRNTGAGVFESHREKTTSLVELEFSEINLRVKTF